MSDYSEWYAKNHHLITEKAHLYVVGLEAKLESLQDCSRCNRLEAKLDALREAHKANLHQELRSACGARGHRCDWRVAYEAVVQRSKAALEAGK